MRHDWIQNMYRNKFPKLFKSITQVIVDEKINIYDACADTENNINLDDITSSDDHTLIHIKYRQIHNNSCGYYSFASVLHHIQDADLGLAIKESYNEKKQLKIPFHKYAIVKKLLKTKVRNMF